MSQGLIYTVEPDGGLRRMAPSAPENEDRIQTLVARYPELITDGDGDLLLIQRELSIADGDETAGRWSLDHLFVTREAVPVLVEVKRAVDTRLRREVVGQLLDYASNAVAHWPAGRVAESFAATAAKAGIDPDSALKDFIGSQEASSFWEQIDANFKAGRIKLVFVADDIPSELATIVEFLNEQMRADVRAIELRWFSSEGGIVALSPRVIGETARSAATKGSSRSLPRISSDEWLQKHVAPAGDRAMDGARAYMEIVTALGGEVAVSDRQGSIYATFRGTDGKVFYPLHLWSEKQLLSFSLMWLHRRPSLQDEAVRQRLLDDLTAIVGSTTTRNLTGFPSFNVALLADPTVAARIAAWLKSALEIMR
jgi:hypothetical protein